MCEKEELIERMKANAPESGRRFGSVPWGQCLGHSTVCNLYFQRCRDPSSNMARRVLHRVIILFICECTCVCVCVSAQRARTLAHMPGYSCSHVHATVSHGGQRTILKSQFSPSNVSSWDQTQVSGA